MPMTPGQVRVRAAQPWTDPQLYEVIGRLGDDVQVAVSPSRRVIALRFSFNPGASLSESAEAHGNQRIGSVNQLEDVHYQDGRFLQAWDPDGQ